MDIEMRCRDKANELLDKYFGNIVHEAVYERPEKLDERYTKELPFKIEDEFIAYLGELKKELMPDDTRPIDSLIDHPRLRDMIMEDYEVDVDKSFEEATTITLWERITKSNHEDVAYFKGLLKQYTEELLEHTILDFLELGKKIQ